MVTALTSLENMNEIYIDLREYIIIINNYFFNKINNNNRNNIDEKTKKIIEKKITQLQSISIEIKYDS